MTLSNSLGAYAILFSSLLGTSGLCLITFSKKPNPKLAIVLLLIGQAVLLFAIYDMNLSHSLSLNNLSTIMKDIFRLVFFYGPIIVALHYQFSIYQQWKYNKFKNKNTSQAGTDVARKRLPF